MTAHEVEQRSPEWRALRVGRLTSSAAPAMLASLKSAKGEAAARRDLRLRLALERLTGECQENGYQSPDMLRGIEVEPAAIAAYEAETGVLVSRVGFLTHDELLAGASPDGYVGAYEGVIEVKCPKSATHLEYLQARTLPADYKGQVLHLLWLTGAKWCDFISFDPRFPASAQLLVLRVERDDEAIRAYNLVIRLFLKEVEDEVTKILGVTAA